MIQDISTNVQFAQKNSIGKNLKFNSHKNKNIGFVQEDYYINPDNEPNQGIGS